MRHLHDECCLSNLARADDDLNETTRLAASRRLSSVAYGRWNPVDELLSMLSNYTQRVE